MKLFGGGNDRRKSTNTEPGPSRPTAPKSNSGRVTAKKQAAPKSAAGKTAKQQAAKAAQHSKAGKAPLTPQKKKQRGILIMTVVIITILMAVCAGAAAICLIRPPEVPNDPTIKDKENGDAVDVNSLLNSGQRVDDLFTFVVGAVDEDQTRTDALMVATMNTKEKTISVMNIPRDTMCNNGLVGASRKINAAYGMKKGIEQTKKEIERLMGFQPDKYIIVNFDGIAAIVDAIGGVDYEVPFRMEYDDPGQNLHIDLYAGNQHLNGKQTVEFLRWRHNNDYSVQYTNGDEGRVENQQKFLKTVAKEIFQLKNIAKVKSIANAVFENVKTDFTAGELLWMGMQAMQIDNKDIQFFTLPGYGQMSTAGSSDSFSFFFPYYKETLELVNKYFNPFSEPITALDMVNGPEGSGGKTYTIYDSSDDYIWGDSSVYNEPSYWDDDVDDDGYGSGGNNGDGEYDPGYDPEWGPDYNEPSGGDYPDDNEPSSGDDPGYSEPSGGDDPNYSEPSGGNDPGYNEPGGDDPGYSEPSGGDSGGDAGGEFDPEA